jgi:hypothetical protein
MKEIIQDGDLITRRTELMKCWWLIEGFVYRTFLGDPHEPSQYASDYVTSEQQEIKELCCEIASLCGRKIDRGSEEEEWSIDKYLTTAFSVLQKYLFENRLKILH